MLGYARQIFQSRAAHTELNTFTSEAGLLQGNAVQPVIPANELLQYPNEKRRYRLEAKGYVGSTGTPTFTFTVRANTTAGVTNLAGDVIGISAAITTQSGVTARFWSLWLDIVLLTPGNTDAATIQCQGEVSSPGGFAAPYGYGLSPTADTFTTSTATIDLSVAHHLNLSATCGTSNAANLIKCMDCAVWEMN